MSDGVSDSVGDRGIVLHLPEQMLRPDCDDRPAFYNRLIEGFGQAGIPLRLMEMDREQVLDQVESDSWFHILNHGRLRHPRVLNAGIAYIYPFWNLDPWGIRANSSIRDRAFRPGRIDADRARAFFNSLRSRWVEQRQSRYDQPEEPTEIPENALAVFFQGEARRGAGEVCHMDRWTMLETALQAWDGPVVVKPHPLERDAEVYERLLNLQKGAEQLQISNGNIHDILAGCARVLTINSAVGIEAYLHRKPVVLCGQADFHHIADTATTPEALRALLQSDAAQRVHAKYVWWYFGQQCLNAGHRELLSQVVGRIEEQGYALTSRPALS